MPLMLGRKPRTHRPEIPHLSALLAGRTLAPPPAAVDWTQKLGSPLGAMLNDSLGDCTCAAFYHARQVWSANADAAMLTDPDSDVLALYEGACGYVPGDSATDQGGVEQDVLTYLLNTGAPIANGQMRDHIAAFVEVDPRNLDDVKRTIDDCGGIYLGLTIPAYLMAGAPPAVWDLDPSGDQTAIGGHAIYGAGYDADALKIISWGAVYGMTWRFWQQFVDECYAIADATWIGATGKTPLGMALADLEAQMQALREAAI